MPSTSSRRRDRDTRDEQLLINGGEPTKNEKAKEEARLALTQSRIKIFLISSFC